MERNDSPVGWLVALLIVILAFFFFYFLFVRGGFPGTTSDNGDTINIEVPELSPEEDRR